MTSRTINNIKSIIIQLILILLCFYGLQLIQIQKKVIEIKQNWSNFSSISGDKSSHLELPTFKDQLLLNFKNIDSISQKANQEYSKEFNAINSLNTIYKNKIDSLIPILKKLKLSDNLDQIKEKDILKLLELQKSRYNQYYQIVSSMKSNNRINPLWGNSKQEITDKVSNMTISQLVGQLFVIGTESFSITEQELNGLTNFNPTGVILMGKNIIDADQTKILTNFIQSSNPTIPLFISTDQEGGVVKRINWDTVPAQNEWLNTSKEKLCEYGKSRGQTLSQIGINVNFAPVVDLGNNDEAFINSRTISTDPKIVSQKANEYRACAEQNVLNTLKHFPGHGMVTGDSHLTIPVNQDITKEQWLSTHAIPFKDNMDSPMIMSSHVAINKIDNKPASMSNTWITKILKEELGYKGIVITDEMYQYYNISKQDLNQSALDAINAGNDLLLYTGTYKEVLPIKEFLVNHFNDKREQLSTIVQRLLITKSQML